MHTIVYEMNNVQSNRSLSQHRKAAVSFRDQGASRVRTRVTSRALIAVAQHCSRSSSSRCRRCSRSCRHRCSSATVRAAAPRSRRADPLAQRRSATPCLTRASSWRSCACRSTLLARAPTTAATTSAPCRCRPRGARSSRQTTRCGYACVSARGRSCSPRRASCSSTCSERPSRRTARTQCSASCSWRPCGAHWCVCACVCHLLRRS